MPIRIWYGREPDDRGSQDLLIDLFESFKAQPEEYIALFNFMAGRSHEIDLVVLKTNGIFVVEHKRYHNKLVGGPEGPWYTIEESGVQVTVKPEHSNPLRQARSNFWHFREWLIDHTGAICQGEDRLRPPDIRSARSYVVISPDLHPDSQIDLGDGVVPVIGKSRFLVTIKAHNAYGLDFSTDEMGRIPRLLQLKEWQFAPSGTVRVNRSSRPN